MEAFVSTAGCSLSMATRDRNGPGCRRCTSFVPQGMRRLALFAFPNHKAPCLLFPKPVFLLPGLHFLHSTVQWLCRVTKHLTTYLWFVTSVLSPFGFSWLVYCCLLRPHPSKHKSPLGRQLAPHSGTLGRCKIFFLCWDRHALCH